MLASLICALGSCGYGCRLAAFNEKIAKYHSPPPPPLDTWSTAAVERAVGQVGGVNSTAFKTAGIDGVALHELWLSREEALTKAIWNELTQGTDAAARLRLQHKLRGYSRDANAPNPPPPPPPLPQPPPPPRQP